MSDAGAASGPGASPPAVARRAYCFDAKRPPRCVREYFRLHRGELQLVDFPGEDDWFESPHPRHGELAAEDIRRVSVKKARLSNRFPGRGKGCWTLAYDYPGSWSTALVLAVGSALGGPLSAIRTSGMPGGIGADSGEIWLPFLDGGVGVRLDLCQHEVTNRIEGFQTTTIRGPAALAAVFDALRFELPPELLRDVKPPDFAAVSRFVDQRLRGWARREEQRRARRAERAAQRADGLPSARIAAANPSAMTP